MSGRSSSSNSSGIDLAPAADEVVLAGLTAAAACLAVLLLQWPTAAKSLLVLALTCYAGWSWRSRRKYRGVVLRCRGERFVLSRDGAPDRELIFLPQSVIGRQLLLLEFGEPGSTARHGFLLTAYRCRGEWRALRRQCQRAQSACAGSSMVSRASGSSSG